MALPDNFVSAFWPGVGQAMLSYQDDDSISSQRDYGFLKAAQQTPRLMDMTPLQGSEKVLLPDWGEARNIQSCKHAHQVKSHISTDLNEAHVEQAENIDVSTSSGGPICWLARHYTNPHLLAQATELLSKRCDTGTRHFAANGASVLLADAALMAREIRRYDLEKADICEPAS